MTHTQYCGKTVDGEKCSNSYIKTLVKIPPAQTHYSRIMIDTAMSSGGNGSPMLDFAQGVVFHQDAHSKCPRGSRSW